MDIFLFVIRLFSFGSYSKRNREKGRLKKGSRKETVRRQREGSRETQREYIHWHIYTKTQRKIPRCRLGKEIEVTEVVTQRERRQRSTRKTRRESYRTSVQVCSCVQAHAQSQTRREQVDKTLTHAAHSHGRQLLWWIDCQI